MSLSRYNTLGEDNLWTTLTLTGHASCGLAIRGNSSAVPGHRSKNSHSCGSGNSGKLGDRLLALWRSEIKWLVFCRRKRDDHPPMTRVRSFRIARTEGNDHPPMTRVRSFRTPRKQGGQSSTKKLRSIDPDISRSISTIAPGPVKSGKSLPKSCRKLESD